MSNRSNISGSGAGIGQGQSKPVPTAVPPKITPVTDIAKPLPSGITASEVSPDPTVPSTTEKELRVAAQKLLDISAVLDNPHFRMGDYVDATKIIKILNRKDS